MVKTAIVYASTHHQNTFKLVKTLAERFDITLIDATQQNKSDLSAYNLVGFASGIDFGRFYPSVEQFLEDNLPFDKSVFFIYTCAKTDRKFTQSIKTKALEKNAFILGEYGCKGYNTYGPLKLIGGINKNHPTDQEINDAVTFFESLICKFHNTTI